MADMGIQDRYDDICARSGLSEEIIRRALKASRESLAQSLKKGERATLPGICTMIPEIRHRIDHSSELGGTVTKYTKVKAIPSSAMETEMEKIQQFNTTTIDEALKIEEEEVMQKLNFLDAGKVNNPKTYGVRTAQINALL